MEPVNSGDGLTGEFPDLLQLCARAEALIAELLLLSDRLPSQFLDPQYDPVLFDLRYFECPRDYEARINASNELQALEDELNELCATYLERFFLMANGVVQYHIDLVKYLINLQDGLDVHFTLEGILENKQGFQLLTESVSMFGCILLLMEHKFSGSLQEKLLILFLRADQSFKFPNLDQICALCRSHKTTKSISDTMNIQNTEGLFAKFPFSTVVIDAIIISCLRGDDMYNNICFFTDPIHRTMALSRQGGHLYLLLFYSRSFLSDSSFMREVVDRFFKDNWVVPVILHFSVDLLVSWDPYREAKAALVECVSPTVIRDRCMYHCTKVTNLMKELDSAPCDGALRKHFFMDDSQQLLSLINVCNLTLRWLLLHRMSNDKKAREIVMTVCTAHQVDEESLLQLLLKSSKVEYELKEMYSELLSDREAIWHEKKSVASECINNLSRNNLGSSGSSSKFKNKTLKEWFDNLLSEVNLLEYAGGTGSTSRAIYRIIFSLKDLEQIQENIQTKDALLKARKSLHDMIKILSLDNQAMHALFVITDGLYAWGYIKRFQDTLKNKIKEDISILLVLNALFVKFRSLLSAPLQRISECKSQDLACISSYYSMKYSMEILAILESIPVILLDIGLYEDSSQLPQPSHINKETIEDFIQVDKQLQGARHATKLCVISEGIQIMSRTFDGIVNLKYNNLKRWLEEKLRKEVARQLEIKLDSFFSSSHAGRNDLERSMHSLFNYVTLQSQKLELFQDILHMRGAQLWDEAFSSVLGACLMREETELKVQALDLKNLIPHPKSFIGLLLRKILQLTDPSQSMFIEPMLGWFDAEGNEILGLHFFTLLESCIGQVGLAGLDSLVATLVSISLENMLNSLNILLDSKFLEEMQKLDEMLGPPSSIPLVGLPLYNNMVHMFSAPWEPLVDKCATIGQLQLLRSLANFRLKSASKCKVSMATSATDALISAISMQRDKLVEVKGNEEDSTKDLLLNALNREGKLCGFLRPFNSRYISKEAPVFLSRFVSLLSISQLCRYVFDAHLGTLTSRSKISLKDFSPLIIGLGTLLRQFHPLYTTQYIQFMTQYLHTMEASFVATDKPSPITTNRACEVAKGLFWLRSFCKYMEISEDLTELCLGRSIIALLQL